MYLRILFNWLAPPLRPVEQEILSAVERALPATIAEPLRARRESINYVQRRVGGREVGLYTIRRGRAVQDPAWRAPIGGQEWRLARVVLRKDGQRWTATVYSVDGHLSSIEYDQAPPRDASGIIVDSVEVFVEPPPAPRSKASPGRLPDWLQPYVERYGIDGIDPPLEAPDQAAAVERLEVVLPDDYLAFIALSDGVRVGPLSLLGLTEAYDALTEDADYVVLGEVGGRGALAVRKPGPEIVWIDFNDDTIEPLGRSLREALQHVVPRT